MLWRKFITELHAILMKWSEHVAILLFETVIQSAYSQINAFHYQWQTCRKLVATQLQQIFSTNLKDLLEGKSKGPLVYTLLILVAYLPYPITIHRLLSVSWGFPGSSFTMPLSKLVATKMPKALLDTVLRMLSQHRNQTFKNTFHDLSIHLSPALIACTELQISNCHCLLAIFDILTFQNYSLFLVWNNYAGMSSLNC